MPKRTRNRQLARLAAQRQMEKRRRQRRRQTATIAVALVVALAGGAVAYLAFRDDGTDAAGATGPTAETGPTGGTGASPSPDGKPGRRTGTVEPTAGPAEVACGGEAPANALEPKPQFAAPKQVVKDGAAYTATLQTSCGEITVELLAEQAPETVNSFVFLARQGYFDATRIHRIALGIDVIQGGDPMGTGTGGPGYSIPDELAGEETYPPGTLAMANSGPDTGGSQFFLITGEDGHGLDANPAYTVFGRVREGLDVARRLQEVPIEGEVEDGPPAQAIYIEKVTISTGS